MQRDMLNIAFYIFGFCTFLVFERLFWQRIRLRTLRQCINRFLRLLHGFLKRCRSAWGVCHSEHCISEWLALIGASKKSVAYCCASCRRVHCCPIIEQDPLVTIDIITHRYYGVGGQWVQDAGEYLHMMSDAGIRIKGEWDRFCKR